MPRFSVITPVHAWNELKIKQLHRCEFSVIRQKLWIDDYEHIVVDDGSTIDLQLQPETKLIKMEHANRIAAYNLGFSLAEGDWFVLCDSDDELLSHTLKYLDQIIKKNPRRKLFNFGSIHVNLNYITTTRGAFKPEKKKRGHEVFGGGNIVNGTFVFHRSIYDKWGGFPEMYHEKIDCTEINYGGVRSLWMGSPYDFAAYAQLEYPEIRQFFMVNHEAEPNKIIKELGNPWGNDFYLFYKYTRKYHSVPFDTPIIMIHHEGREGEGHYVK